MYTQTYNRIHLRTHAANQIKWAIVASNRRRAGAQDFGDLGVDTLIFRNSVDQNSKIRFRFRFSEIQSDSDLQRILDEGLQGSPRHYGKCLSGIGDQRCRCRR